MKHITANSAKARGWTLAMYLQYTQNYIAWAKACYDLLVSRYGKNCIVYNPVQALIDEFCFPVNCADAALKAMKIAKLIEKQGEGYAL